jgi:hypothetical protein
MSIDENTLSNWTKPGFQNEEEMAENTRKAVQGAINKNSVLKNINIRVFPKGSYANNTNVRRDSDIDIAVMLKDIIRTKYPEGITNEDTGLVTYTGIPILELKKHLQTALENEFGSFNVDSSGNKIFSIRGSDKILNADVIPCTNYRYYYNAKKYREGIELILNNSQNERFINYPDQHHDNGVTKNLSTQKRYKSIVRILKNIRNSQLESKNYPSFMIESLVFNINDLVFSGEYNGWKDIIEQVCMDSLQYLDLEEPSISERRWMEVNKYKYLFDKSQKWTREDAQQFILDVYNLL